MIERNCAICGSSSNDVQFEVVNDRYNNRCNTCKRRLNYNRKKSIAMANRRIARARISLKIMEYFKEKSYG